ncbi:MAG: hypothetical protein LBD23_07260, partial [Oscillospiraceae bacterium]|nr:hypothetical protein [Oscillospiraceae bacterium]
MKKILFISIAICMIAGVSATAQVNTFNKGDNVVNVGVGLFGGLYSYTGWGDSRISKIPFISASYENCIMDNLFDAKSSIGVGGIVGFSSASIANYWKHSNFLIGGRGAFHYALVDRLDTYAGLTIAFNVVSWKWHSSYAGPHDGGANSARTF